MSDRPRVFLVTGSGSGIGAAVCRRLAGPDTAFLIHARSNADGVARIAQEVIEAGGRAETMLGDLTDPALPAALVARAVAAFGALDVLVANAGFADRTRIADLDEAGWMRSVDTIQHGLFRLARAAMPHLAEGRDARLIAISSFVAHVFRPDLPVFAASAAAKAASEALVRALAVEFAPRGVLVNAVAPGFIEKDKGTHAAAPPLQRQAAATAIPLGRLGKPAEIAAAVAFLASLEASYVTGQVIHVNGGLV